jgi:hypothetical protein
MLVAGGDWPLQSMESKVMEGQWSNSNIRIPLQQAPLRMLELKDH